MTTKTIRCGATITALLVLVGFISQAQAQIVVGANGLVYNLRSSTFPVGGVGPIGGLNYLQNQAARAAVTQAVIGNGIAYNNMGYLQTGYSPVGYNSLYNPPAYGYPAIANYGGGTATLSTTSVGAGWGNVTPSYDSYPDPYMPNSSPYGGALRGKADLTTAAGNFMVSTQRARLVQEEANRSQIDTRRKIWEEAKWERMNTVFTEDYREQLLKTEQRRARLEPPLQEIWSARTLNVLLEATGAQQAKGVRGPNVQLHEETLKHINLTSGANGNIGLFKNDLQWPASLQGPEFTETVKKLNERIPEAVQQAKLNPNVDAGLLKDVNDGVQQMYDILLKNVGEMPSADYIEAKRYLNQLSEAVRALKDPNVQNYLNGKWSAKGKNVAELVDSLRQTGLSFAPATPGDEAAYRALYYALYSYDAGMTQLATREPMPMPGTNYGDK
jgi:hypothetical protein